MHKNGGNKKFTRGWSKSLRKYSVAQIVTARLKEPSRRAVTFINLNKKPNAQSKTTGYALNDCQLRHKVEFNKKSNPFLSAVNLFLIRQFSPTFVIRTLT